MKIDVLDHGYVRFIEAWGHGDQEEPFNSHMKEHMDLERGIIEAARQSTQGSFRGWEKDRHLLEYLYEHKHSTPFEFAGAVFEVQAPISVFRQWFTHRTQSRSEMSGRYAQLPDLYYNPDFDMVMERALMATVNKQAGTVSPPSANFPDDVKNWLDQGKELQRLFELHYRHGLAIGIPKEIARNDMPVSHYSRMRVAANLRNWLAFLTLRTDPHAAWEIRQFAKAVGQIVHQKFPRTFFFWAKEVSNETVS